MVNTITASIRRISGWAMAKRMPSASALNTCRRSPGRCGTFTRATATITAKKLAALHHRRRADATDRNRERRQRRTDDPAEVPLRVRQADAGNQVLACDEIRQDRLECWKRECADAPGHEAERGDAERGRRASTDPYREDRRNHRRQGVADDEHAAPAPPVRHGRADRAEHAIGQEACGTDQRRPRGFPGGVGDVVGQTH